MSKTRLIHSPLLVGACRRDATVLIHELEHLHYASVNLSVRLVTWSSRSSHRTLDGRGGLIISSQWRPLLQTSGLRYETQAKRKSHEPSCKSAQFFRYAVYNTTPFARVFIAISTQSSETRTWRTVSDTHKCSITFRDSRPSKGVLLIDSACCAIHCTLFEFLSSRFSLPRS